MAEVIHPTNTIALTSTASEWAGSVYREPVSLRRPSRSQLDYQLGGDGMGRVRGRTVEQIDQNSPKVPVSRRVRLYRDRDGLLVRETWSNAAGEYDFPRIDSRITYTAMSYDHRGNFRAVVADRVTPEAMP